MKKRGNLITLLIVLALLAAAGALVIKERAPKSHARINPSAAETLRYIAEDMARDQPIPMDLNDRNIFAPSLRDYENRQKLRSFLDKLGEFNPETAEEMKQSLKLDKDFIIPEQLMEYYFPELQEQSDTQHLGSQLMILTPYSDHGPLEWETELRERYHFDRE